MTPGDRSTFMAPPADTTTPARRRGGRVSRYERAKAKQTVLKLAALGHSVELIAATYNEMANKTGAQAITPKRVKSILDEALAAYAPDQQQVERIRAEQLRTLDALKDALSTRVLQGDVMAVRTVVDIEKMRARLIGTEKPVEHKHSGTVGFELVDPREVAELEARYRGDVVEGSAVELPMSSDPGESVPDNGHTEG